MPVVIRPVQSRADRRAFVRLPLRIPHAHAQWVPPLLSDDARTFDVRRNPAFRYCAATFALALRDNVPVGRIAGLVNHRHNAAVGERTARFGFVETVDDADVMTALLRHVEEWSRGLGMTRIVGPMGFTDQDPEGLLVEGFDNMGTIATFMNEPHVVTLLEANAYTKEVDFVAYLVPVPNAILPAYERVVRHLTGRTKYQLVQFRRRRDLKPYIHPILELMNSAFSRNYGYVALDAVERTDLAKRYLPLLDPRFVKVVEYEGRVVGFGIGMPHIDDGLRRARGRLLPFGFVHVLRALRTARQLDLLLEAIDERHRGRGVDAILGASMIRTAEAAGMTCLDSHLELESNRVIRASMERAGGTVIKRYRIFQKTL